MTAPFTVAADRPTPTQRVKLLATPRATSWLWLCACGRNGRPQYTAAKHGVLGLTKQAAQEYAAEGIRVNAVLPGQTETVPMRAYLDALPDGGEKMMRRLPMKRMARPLEIAQAVVWLCSDEASYVNGDSLVVDGGLIAR